LSPSIMETVQQRVAENSLHLLSLPQEKKRNDENDKIPA